MIWIDLVLKGLISGGLIVGASELAKRSVVFGAMVLCFVDVLVLCWGDL